MDPATQLAIRAVVRGLSQSPAIEEEQIRFIMEELSKAADLRRDRGRIEDQNALLALASDIAKDANLVV